MQNLNTRYAVLSAEMHRCAEYGSKVNVECETRVTGGVDDHDWIHCRCISMSEPQTTREAYRSDCGPDDGVNGDKARQVHFVRGL